MDTYKTRVEWKEGLIGDLRTESGSGMQFSTTKEFGGPGGMLTPAELFVAAENTCYMMTLLAFVNKMRVQMVSYECDAIGHLEEIDNKRQITRIILRPRIVLKTQDDVGKIPKVIELSKKYCFVERSIKTKVEIEPEVIVSED